MEDGTEEILALFCKKLLEERKNFLTFVFSEQKSSRQDYFLLDWKSEDECFFTVSIFSFFLDVWYFLIIVTELDFWFFLVFPFLV